MTFHSILFVSDEDHAAEPLEAPAFFADLNLDQIIDAITTGRQEYHLQPFFYAPLHDLDAIAYRHEIMRDLEQPELFELMQSFARQMRKMRTSLVQAEKRYYSLQKQRWFVDAVETYCDAVMDLRHRLSLVEIQSRGLLAFRAWVTTYTQTGRFPALLAETKQVQAEMSAVRYCLRIRGNHVQVRRYEAERDYSEEVAHTFAKFQQGAVKDYRVTFSTWQEMDHVEAQILELVAKLYPDLFARLAAYCATNRSYLDETIATFDREIQFYLASLEYLAPLQRAGLPYCYPHLSLTSKEESVHEGLDLALASKLLTEHLPVVCNDFTPAGEERMLVVTGPNQGGKTTFARMVGQMHYLASLGCPVAGKDAHLFLCDQFFTHFEQEETITTLRGKYATMKSGKLDEELSRMNAIIDTIRPDALVLFNESFAATNDREGSEIARQITSALIEKRIKVFFVTHLSAFAQGWHHAHRANVLFLRAERQADGTRTFKLIEGEPLNTSYGVDVYRQIFDGEKEGGTERQEQ